MTDNSITRRRFLITTGTGVAGLAGLSAWGRFARGAAPSGPDDRSGHPNIIVIVADDLGYAGLGCYGCKDIPTPNIDSLATNGVRFTNSYVSCPVCSPTRAGLMTGRYQERFGHEFNPGPAEQADDNFGLPLTETTLADRLKAAGYATGMVGKWHLGSRPEYVPTKRGFDEFFGFLAGAHPYFVGAARGNPILRGTTKVDEKEYLTDAFTREAVAFIDLRKAKPFFLYLPFNAVHAPLQAPANYLERFKTIEDKDRQTHAAMLAAMDDGVGKVLDKLRKLELEKDTLVFFFSDNGGPTAQTTSRNDPLRGFKAQVLEGGIRTPAMMQWKGRLPAGKVYDQPTIQLDILPTALSAAGVKIQPDWKLDGVNLVPYLTGQEKGPPHETLFWRFGRQWAVRRGDWKLVQQPGGPRRQAAPQLFNLADDIGEKNDLAAKQPEKVKELQAAYDAWNAQLEKPRWGGGGRGGRRPATRATTQP